MWGGLEKISEQVTSYSTLPGKLWYLLVFVFRLIVVVTIGAPVYSDEQSAFRCSTKVLGCDNVCYDRFSKISHLRFWSFQLLAVAAPAVMFHFFTGHVQGRIEKIKKAENAQVTDEEEMASVFGSVLESRSRSPDEIKRIKERKRMERRRKSVGVVKLKRVYANNKLVDLNLTRDIRIAYFVNVVLRIILEFISLVLTYELFHFTDYTVEQTNNPLEWLLIRVPQVYRCDGENVDWACNQHLNLGAPGYVPCWVSRPWEKTIFMCYMNVLSFICFLLSLIEMIQLSVKFCKTLRRKRTKNFGIPQEQDYDTTDGPPPKFNIDRTETMKSGMPPVMQDKANKPVVIPFNTIEKRKFRWKKNHYKDKSVGIRILKSQEDLDENSVGYHSSQYASGSEEDDESLASVSIQMSD